MAVLTAPPLDMVPLVDAARAAGLSYGQVWRLCLRQDVRSERRGRAWFVSLSSLQEHLREPLSLPETTDAAH